MSRKRQRDPEIAQLAASNVVKFRPRSEVPRTIERFRSLPPDARWYEALPVRMDASINVGCFMRALRAGGFAFKFDERLQAVVILAAVVH